MDIREIKSSVAATHQCQSLSSNSVYFSIPFPQHNVGSTKSFRAYPGNFVSESGFLITRFDRNGVITVPFEEVISKQLQEEARQLPYFVPTCLANARHAALKEGDFFITEDVNGDGFWLYTSEGKRHFEAYQVEDDGKLIIFFKNKVTITTHRVEDLHDHTLRNPHTLVPVTA